jgi:predicted N-acetyltransferase YhbS
MWHIVGRLRIAHKMAFEMIVSKRISETAPLTETLVLRRLARPDAGEAARVVRAAFAAQRITTRPPPSALRETEESIVSKIARGGGFGISVDGALIAVALWQVDGKTLMIARVAVLPAWRGHGLAGRLMSLCEAEARALGAARMRLKARLELPENERMFERFGFARIGTEAHAGFERPTTALMEKRLS